jgi:hypothetical protein
MKRSIVVFLAMAALAAVPVASAFPASSGGETTAGLRADGLRWQAIAAAYGAGLGETRAGLHADGLRWQAEARAYRAAAARGSRTFAYVLIALGGLAAATCTFVLVGLRTRRVVTSAVVRAES